MAVLALAASCVEASVLVIARPGPAGPAAALAGDQIARWPFGQQAFQVVSSPPAQLPADVTLVVELVEDFDFRAEMPMANGATIRATGATAAQAQQARQLAQRAADAINSEIQVPTEAFVVESSTDPKAASVPTITITTSTKNEVERQRIAKRTRQLRVGTFAILSATSAVDGKASSQSLATPPKSGVLRVAFYDDIGARNRTEGCNPVWVRQTLRGLSDLSVELVSAEDIRQGVLDRQQFDVLIVGGGSSKTQAKTLGDTGKAAVTRFVDSGGGYVGICAGAFLAARNSFGLALLPVRSQPSGGGGDAALKLTDEAKQASAIDIDTPAVAFHGGPILKLEPDAAAANTRVWAMFARDVVSKANGNNDEDGAAAKPGKVLPLGGTPAVVSAERGKGRVVILSPHPERAPGPQQLFWTAIRYAGGQTEQQQRAAARASVGVLHADQGQNSRKIGQTEKGNDGSSESRAGD